MKKIKFPLIMKDNIQVRTIEELREHFDFVKAIEYFLNGKLKTWLEQRYYDSEAAAISLLEEHDPDFHQKLCDTLGVEYKSEDIKFDVDFVKDRARRLAELKQYTSDSTILSEVDNVAFNQEELAYLLDEGVHDIYLCNNTFTIPLRVTKKKYIGIGKAVAVIHSKDEVDFWLKDIEFVNVKFDAEYEKIHNPSPERLYQMGLAFYKESDYLRAWNCFVKSANLGNSDAMTELGIIYLDHVPRYGDYPWAQESTDYLSSGKYPSDGILRRKNFSIKYFQQAADLGNSRAMYLLAKEYLWGDEPYIPQDIEKGKKLLYQSIDRGNSWAMLELGEFYLYGYCGFEKNVEESIRWFEKAMNTCEPTPLAAYRLGEIYSLSEDTKAMWDYSKADYWFKRYERVDLRAELFLNHHFFPTFNENERLSKAIDLMEKEVPDDCKYADLPRYYLKRNQHGDFDKAIDYLKKWHDYIKLGDAYKEKGIFDQAIISYEKYLLQTEKCDSSYSSVKEKLEWCKNQRNMSI